MPRFHFTDCLQRSGVCEIDILRKDECVVVICTELFGYTGPSVTNSAEHIADQVCVQFRIDPKQLVWIERYHDKPKETDIVTFKWNPISIPHFTDASWRPLTADEANELGVGYLFKDDPPDSDPPDFGDHVFS